MARTISSDEKIHEALALLNDAAKEKGEELQRLIAGKYTDLKSVLGEAAQASGDWLKKEGKTVAATTRRPVAAAKRRSRS